MKKLLLGIALLTSVTTFAGETIDDKSMIHLTLTDNPEIMSPATAYTLTTGEVAVVDSIELIGNSECYKRVKLTWTGKESGKTSRFEMNTDKCVETF